MGKIIAFGHRRYVGKDTAANLLVTHIRSTKRNVLVRKIGFASKGKAIAHDLYGWAGLEDEEYYEKYPHLKDAILPLLGKSPREIWIGLMDTVREKCHERTWIYYPLKTIADYTIIKDLRYINEVKEILEIGGRVYRIDNPKVQKYDDPADSNLANFTEWSGVIINDGDLRQLNNRVLELIGNYI